jgi:ribosomal protein S17
MSDNKKTVTRNPISAVVVSLSKDGTTVKVSIPRVVPNKLYDKRMHLNTVILADAKGRTDIVVGSSVKILPCRKISKCKSWRVISSN